MLQLIGTCLKMCAVLVFVLVLGIVLFPGAKAFAEAPEQIMKLLPPQKDVGKPLMEALNLRKSHRGMTNQAISEQDLSNLLWAGFGANRADGRRTVPTARNTQDVKVYVVLKTGVWEYDGLKQILTLVKAGDLTPKFGATVTLLYVAPQEPADVSGMHVGSIYQNVALYCASANLATVTKTSARNALDKDIKLPEGYKVFLVQLIGRPA